MLATIHSGALSGVHSLPIDIEVNTGERGDLRFVLVGLPDAAVKESLDRVCSALQNSNFKLPRTRTTINLSPGNIRKEGPIYDLPIALGMLISSRQIPYNDVSHYLFAGELSLSGKILPIKGAIALAIQARKYGFKGVVLPKDCAQEALLIEGIEVYGVRDLKEVVTWITNPTSLAPLSRDSHQFPSQSTIAKEMLDFSDIRGQDRAKRAAEVAICGGHNLLLIGNPGTGKSMLAKRIPTILPQPTLQEWIEILEVYSAAGSLSQQDLTQPFRPFRAPHHTISRYGLIGGGKIPQPGEISLAHNGVLFLDEIAEFPRATLETLRQPMEDGNISISRTSGKIIFPSRFALVAAMNPCPCGYLGSSHHTCHCSSKQIHDYRARLSGPLLDRIELHVEMNSSPEIFSEKFASNERSADIRTRIEIAQQRQHQRFKSVNIFLNSQIPDGQLKTFCALGEAEYSLIQQACQTGLLSSRAQSKVLKLARTIADLASHEKIQQDDLLEALQYRVINSD